MLNIGLMKENIVSIQLGSPASGDTHFEDKDMPTSAIVSIQLGSPASGDLKESDVLTHSPMFPFNWDPQRVGTFKGNKSKKRS